MSAWMPWLIQSSLTLCLLIPLSWTLSLMLRRYCGARLAYAGWLLPLLAFLPQSWRVPAAVILPDLQVGPELMPAWSGDSVSTFSGPGSWLLLIWMLGVVVALTRLIWVQHRVRCAIGGSVLGAPERMARGLAHWPQWLPVIESPAIHGPLLLGSLPPKLVVPAREKRLHPWILAHERAHCSHGDPLWNLLLAMLRAIFWFHPLVQLAAGRIRRDQEMAADEAVTAGLSIQDRRAYGQLLLNQALNPAAGLSLSWKSTHPIKERIMTTLKSTPGAARRFTGLGLLGIGLALGLLLVAQADTGGTQAKSPTSSGVPQDDDVQPQALVRIAPRYPRHAAEEGIEGSVTLEAEVSEDGSVHSVRVIASEPGGVFDQAAVEAFSQWRFDPTQDGRHEMGSGLAASALTVRQTIEFQLD